MAVERDHIYLAPGDAHLLVVKNGRRHEIALDRRMVEPRDGCYQFGRWLIAPGTLFHAQRQPSTLMRINMATSQDAAFWKALQRARDQLR